METWTSAGAAGALMLGLTALVPASAIAQVGRGEDGEIDNLVHAEGTVTAPLGTLGAVEKRGSGPVDLLLIPGASFGWTVWEDFMERHADRFTMWAITPPGYDGTPAPPMPASRDMTDRVWSDALVERLAELVREAGMERPVVVGHHLMGDYYALRLGAEYPELVGGVAVLAGVPTRDQPSPSDSTGRAPASPEEKPAVVHERWVPFYRSVDMETWRNGTYQGPAFTFDEARGQELFEDQIATPLPVQIRYFLEYLTSDMRPVLADYPVPLLAVLATEHATLEAFLDANPEMIEQSGRSREEVRDFFVNRFGSAEAAIENLQGVAPWTGLDPAPPDLEIEVIDGSRIFLMEDRPRELERTLTEWIERKVGGS